MDKYKVCFDWQKSLKQLKAHTREDFQILLFEYRCPGDLLLFRKHENDHQSLMSRTDG